MFTKIFAGIAAGFMALTGSFNGGGQSQGGDNVVRANDINKVHSSRLDVGTSTGLALGTITHVSGGVFTLQVTGKNMPTTTTINLTPSTTVLRANKGRQVVDSDDDLLEGETVLVSGKRNNDGSITATSVRVGQLAPKIGVAASSTRIHPKIRSVIEDKRDNKATVGGVRKARDDN